MMRREAASVALKALVPILVSMLALLAHAQPADTAIPEDDIAALRAVLTAAIGETDSRVSRRRALKRVVREGRAIASSSAEAANRFVVLGIVFEGQKRLFALEGTERNRSALFEAAEALSPAPDTYAKLRLEADLLLLEKRQSEAQATLAEHAAALAALLERYRGTAAEARSLMLGSLIARKLNAPELEREIQSAMDEGYADDLEVIAFRNKHLAAGRLDVRFKGTFERLDGARLSFPSDTLGHLCLLVFWSKEARTIEPLMQTIKDYEEQFPGRFDVFSLNVDELPDAGQSILNERGLDWTVLRVRGGRAHPAYRAYAGRDALALLVNAYGYTVLMPEAHMDATGWRGVQTGVLGISHERISQDRYLSQMQWLFSGGFLVESGEWPAEIRECFVPPPFRYRLMRGEALAGYREAETLCADALKKDIGSLAAPEVRDCRIIALLGMANLSIEPRYLEEAVGEAKAAMKEQPEAAHVVARYCLAKAALRENGKDSDSIVAGFFEACGGSNSAPASAVAGAAMLALEAGSRELHEKYRALFLAQHADDPRYYAFASFLRDPQHRFRLLMPNHTKHERYDRHFVVDFGGEPTTNRLPRIELTRLDGQPLVLPDTHADKLTILLFLEPPENDGENFPAPVDRNGKPDYRSGVRGMVHYAQLVTDKHIHQGIDLIAVFLCDDAKRVSWLMKENAWTFQAAMVPGGMANPMVNRLGILSADRFPNVFVLRRDGTIAWWASGMQYREFGNPWVRHLAMKVHIEASEVAHGVRLLEKGEFEAAARIFAGPYLPWRPDRYGWRPVRYHGMALALAGAKDWAGALAAIDKSIDAHKLRHFRGRRSKDVTKWREDAATVEISQPCAVLADLWSTKATILEKLGQLAEASAERKRAEEPVNDEHEDIYTEFHKKLQQLAPRCLAVGSALKIQN